MTKKVNKQKCFCHNYEFKLGNLKREILTKGYVTCKFSARGEIHPRMNSTLPMIKVLFVVTC